jgi:hypothetical protein
MLMLGLLSFVSIVQVILASHSLISKKRDLDFKPSDVVGLYCCAGFTITLMVYVIFNLNHYRTDVICCNGGICNIDVVHSFSGEQA